MIRQRAFSIAHHGLESSWSKVDVVILQFDLINGEENRSF
jgi:hypothetical protein